MPTVTVTIPVYNVEKYILRCIESVISQTISDIEIIVVNDKTTDNSISIVNEIAKKDSRIRIIEHSENKGLMCARKTGYESASGKYVFFLDGDDSLPKDALEILYKEADRTDADFVAGRLTYITSKGIDEKSYPCSLKYGTDRVSAIKSTLLWEMPHTLCGKLFKRELFCNKVYDTLEHYTNGEDGLLYYQIMRHVNRVSCVNNNVYNYYQNNQSSTQVVYSKKTIKSILHLYEFRYKELNNITELKSVLDFATVRDLSILCGMGYQRKRINELLLTTEIPIQINMMAIARYCNIKEAVKCLIRVYVLSLLRKK